MDDLDEEVPEAEKERLIKQVMKERHESLGPMTAHELSVFVCFITTETNPKNSPAMRQ